MRSCATSVPIVWIIATIVSGCMDRKPAPVCPVPIEVATNNVEIGQFDGVDLLAVVDNSASMGQEQQILAAGFFSLINSLVNPSADWPYPAVTDVRAAVVSSDMGLQYGEDRATTDSPRPSHDLSCDENDSRGDDGQFRGITALGNVVQVISGQIPCEPDGAQCPEGYTCEQGLCNSSDGTDLMTCPALNAPFSETSAEAENASFTAQTACLAIQGTTGCAFEQQLEAAVRGLERDENKSFIADNHLLAVLTVSDEEDCSIKDSGLFSVPEWTTNTDLINVACNRTPENESHLFDTARYRQKLLEVKNNQENAVIFAAVVGVPYEDNTCQGTGTELAANECLSHSAMQLTLGTLVDDPSVIHFTAACQRFDNEGKNLTDARPGRRFVQVAESFGDNGYVYSICNRDWSSAMKQIAGLIAREIQPQCFSKKLEWQVLSEKEASLYPDCENCGFAACDAIMEHSVPIGTAEADLCPPSLYEGLPIEEKSRYMEMITATEVNREGEAQELNVSCPVPKLPAALNCAAAESDIASRFSGRAGWYYCQSGESADQTDPCQDGKDNNNDSLVDCDDPGCKSCDLCGGTDSRCMEGCPYRVVFTKEAETAGRSGTMTIQCMQQFTFEDTNCQENSPSVCNDGLDNDGNGVFDCDNTILSNLPDAHLPDPNCCPMNVENGKCVPLMSRVYENCGHSPAVANVSSDFWQDPANASQVDACADQAERLGCQW